MGSEVILAVGAAMIVWAVIGLAIAFAIKLIGKREKLPGWPILWSAIAGSILTIALSSALNSN